MEVNVSTCYYSNILGISLYYINVNSLLDDAVEVGVVYVLGESFYTNDGEKIL
ncbi:TPA: hypothetical protein ACG3O0_000164 [Clostridioides difficile]